jgi:hypothetical protein
VVCTNWFAKQYKNRSQSRDRLPFTQWQYLDASEGGIFEIVEVDGVLVPRFAAIDDDEVHRTAVSFRICSAHCLIAPNSAE